MTADDSPDKGTPPAHEPADGRGPVARWLATSYADTTPGQRWTTCLCLLLAVLLLGFGLRKGSTVASYALGYPSPTTATSIPGAGPPITAPGPTTALGPVSTGGAAGVPAPGPVAALALGSAAGGPGATGSTPVTTVGPIPAVTTFEGPDHRGWWWQANTGPGLPAVVTPPPDVPSNGLLVEGGAGSRTGSTDACTPLSTAPASACDAYAALIFAVPPGTKPKAITLTVYDPTGSGQTPDATPGTTLELCPLIRPALDAEQGGPVSDGPAFDCTRDATAPEGTGGSTYTFNVGALPVTGGLLAVAVLPTAPTDRVVLAAPGGHSLVGLRPQ